MLKPTIENLYPFIMSQLPRKYGQRIKRNYFDDLGLPHYTTLLINKGPRHYLIITYLCQTQDYEISIRKPQGLINKVTIHKYA